MEVVMLSSDLILESQTARRLYQSYAEQAPIFDYHCHLSAQEILEDQPFANISDIWLKHDHYKWRAMRIAGVPEDLITGSAGPFEKFSAFAHTVARLVGSPLYHWVYLELKTYFGITTPFDETSAREIYDECNAFILERELRPSDLIQQSRVALIGTTDDPVDTLEHHQLLQQRTGTPFKVVPTFRPDRLWKLDQEGYVDYLAQLAEAAGAPSIDRYDTLLAAVRQRITFFAQAGCLMADHSLEQVDLPATSHSQADTVLRLCLAGGTVAPSQIALFRSQLLADLAQLYKQQGWVMQLHIGALRNVNPRRYAVHGPDAGFDIMNDFPVAEALAAFLGRLETEDHLPATILYSLNSKDNLVLSTLPHCFADGKMPGKVQFGAAWWFNDTARGMHEHLEALAAQSMLPVFVGMLTDSRSFLSYTRHDYFRRVLCQFIGERVDNGQFHASEEILRELVEGLCFRNIQRYLGIE
jgi:glucuronate isomerase